MSWTIKDRVQGKRVALVTGAAQLPLAASISRWQRSREALRHLQRNRSKHVLVVTSVEDDGETWWGSEEPGFSLAAAIDHWIDSRLAQEDESAEPPPDRFLVLIPLDERIYLAEVLQGLVREEWVLFPTAAAEHLERHSQANSVIYGFSAGVCTELPEQYVRLESPPFALLQFEFKRPAGLFLRQGLLHPRHALSMAVAVLLAAGLYMGQDALRSGFPNIGGWFGAAPQTVLPTNQPLQIVDPLVSFSAGAELRALARLVASADPLLADGLATLVFGHGRTALYAGSRLSGYPETARSVARNLDADWTLDASGWKLVVAMTDVEIDRRRPGGTEAVTQTLLRHPLKLRLVDGPRPSGGGQQSGNIHIRPVELSVFTVEPEALTAQDLLDAADRLDDLPVILSAADCRFKAFRLETCRMTFEARTL